MQRLYKLRQALKVSHCEVSRAIELREVCAYV